MTINSSTPDGRAPSASLPWPRRSRLPAAGFVVRRVFSGTFALLVLVTIVFIGLHLSGNPVLRMVGDEATFDDIRLLEESLGYADPLYIQYFRFLGVLVTGNFPDSLQYSVPSFDIVLARLPASALLAAAGLAGGVVLGLLAGYLGAFRANQLDGKLAMFALSILQSVPPFLIGIVLVLIFSVRLRMVPTSGYGELRHLFLPAATIALFTAPVVGRVFRASLANTSTLPHVIAARAKSVSETKIRRHHIIANALVPVVTVTGLQLGSLLGGTMIVEQIFGWPGIGQLALNAVSYQDYPLVLACTFAMGLAFLITSCVTDILNRMLDPRGSTQ